MQTDVVYESLRFANRDTLDAAMLAGRMLKKLLSKPKPFDVLRHLGKVVLNECFGAFDISFIFNTDGKVDYSARQIEAVEIPTFLARFSRGYVSRLSACCGCSKFMRILARHASNTVFTIWSFASAGADECRSKFEDPGEDFARDVVGALHVKSFTLRTDGYLGKLPLVEHTSVRSSIVHLLVDTEDVAPPARLLPYLLSSSLKHCSVASRTRPNVTPPVLAWIDEFIKVFLDSPDPSKITPEVTVMIGVSKKHANIDLPRTFKNAAKSKIPKKKLDDLDDYLFGHKDEKTDGGLYSFRAFPHRLNVYVWRAFLQDADCIVYHCECVL